MASKLLLYLSVVGASISVATAQPSAPIRIEGSWTAEVCDCISGERCANTSTSRGVKDREDAAQCCCSSSAPLIWGSPPAKCMEVERCTYNCCAGSQKLCGNTATRICCPAGAKCISGKCSSGPGPSPGPSPCPDPGTERPWWEIVPGLKWFSVLVDIGLPMFFCGTGVAAPCTIRRLRALPWTERNLPRLYQQQSQRAMLMDRENVNSNSSSGSVG